MVIANGRRGAEMNTAQFVALTCIMVGVAIFLIAIFGVLR